MDRARTAPADDLTPPELAKCRLLNTEDVCRVLGLSRPAVIKLMRNEAEHFPAAFPVGNRRYVRLADVQAWVANKAGDEQFKPAAGAA